MSTRKPVSIGQILERLGNSEQQRLARRSQAIGRLEQVLDPLLPAELIGRVRVGNFRDGLLILYVESAAYASILRFQVPQIKRCLLQDGRIRPERIQVRVLPGRAHLDKPTRQASMSAASAAALEGTARSLTDPDLADALARLSQRGRQTRD